MASTATSILDIIAPQFSSDPDKADFISFARQQTSLNFYGSKTERAVALRAAHMMTLRNLAQASGGGSGEVASKKEGDLSISFHKSSNNNNDGSDDLAMTSYGIQLKGLRAGCGVFIGVTGGNDDGY